MKESELKKFEPVKEDSLEETVGGHRHSHSRAYHNGWVAGRVGSIVAGAASIVGVGLKIASMCCATKENQK